MRQPLFLFIFLLASAFITSSSLALTVGFEAAEGYTLAPLCPPSGGQQGWSGGAQVGCTNNDPGDEEIVNTEAYEGSNSWHYARGYGSPGQGTPFSPPMASVAGPGTTFEFSIRFKAASSTGDGSEQNIYMGTAAGTDRTGFNIYLTNDSAGDGLHLFTYDDPVAFTEESRAVHLDRNAWHEVSVVSDLAANPDNDVYQYSVNGSLVYTGNSWPNPWRVDNGFTPAYGNSIKFADGGGDTLAHSGFYYDAMSYDVIPEPHTALLLLAGLGGSAVLRRRHRNS